MTPVLAKVPLPRVHDADLDSAPFRKDITPYATQLSRTGRRTHAERWYTWRATMADLATSLQSHVLTRPHNTYRRGQYHSVIRCHRALRTAWRPLGPTCPSRDVRARCIFWWAVRRVPELCASFVRGNHSSW